MGLCFQLGLVQIRAQLSLVHLLSGLELLRDLPRLPPPGPKDLPPMLDWSARLDGCLTILVSWQSFLFKSRSQAATGLCGTYMIVGLSPPRASIMCSKLFTAFLGDNDHCHNLRSTQGLLYYEGSLSFTF